MNEMALSEYFKCCVESENECEKFMNERSDHLWKWNLEAQEKTNEEVVDIVTGGLEEKINIPVTETILWGWRNFKIVDGNYFGFIAYIVTDEAFYFIEDLDIKWTRIAYSKIKDVHASESKRELEVVLEDQTSSKIIDLDLGPLQYIKGFLLYAHKVWVNENAALVKKESNQMIQTNRTKADLAKIIYSIHQESPLLIAKRGFTDFSLHNKAMFSYDKSLTSTRIFSFKENEWEDDEVLICVLKFINNGSLSISNRALYLNDSKKFEQGRIPYNEILQFEYSEETDVLRIYTTTELKISSLALNKRALTAFLHFATGMIEDVNLLQQIHQKHKNAQKDDESKATQKVEIPVNADNSNESLITGLIYSDISHANTLYATRMFTTPKGHGFAAECANHLRDKIQHMDFFGQGKVQLVGEQKDPTTGRIIKNGADRIVNGEYIQTKYCRSGSACVSECFENNQFRYLNADGSPMQIEVPSDMYDAAVQAMQERIKRGEVPGVKDPNQAKNIIRKGHYTYKQARNIAKAGNIDSLKFDAMNGAIVATSAMGITFALQFVQICLNEKDAKKALKGAVIEGLKSGGFSFVTSVVASQLQKTTLARGVFIASSDAIAKALGPKGCSVLVNAFRSSGKNIYGAAATKSAAKLLRGNVVMASITAVALSAWDARKLIDGRISGGQYIKNTIRTGSSVAGGTAGAVAGGAMGAKIGAVIGTFFAPGAGTAIGGTIGGLVGSLMGGVVAGSASGKAADSVTGVFIEDDAVKMEKILKNVIHQLVEEYLLSQDECNSIIQQINSIIEKRKNFFEEMHASTDREQFVRNLFEPLFERKIAKRKPTKMPSAEAICATLREVLEDIPDAIEDDSSGYVNG